MSAKILCTQRNDDERRKSACFGVSAARCPAKDQPCHMVIEVDTETGDVTLPQDRFCRHDW